MRLALVAVGIATLATAIGFGAYYLNGVRADRAVDRYMRGRDG